MKRNPTSSYLISIHWSDKNVTLTNGTPDGNISILGFFAAAHPLVLVGQNICSSDSPAGLHVLRVVGVHRFPVGSARRAHPVTSVRRTGLLLSYNLEIKKYKTHVKKDQIYLKILRNINTDQV